MAKRFPAFLRILDSVKEYAGIVIGSVIIALALDMFLVPGKIAAGGVSGLATVTHYAFGWPVGVTMLAANVPLFIAGVRLIGATFGLKTLVGTLMTSLLVDFLAPFVPVLTMDPALASVYGGVLSGLGIGITFRFGGSTGGTDLIARIIHHVTQLTVGRALLLVDGIVIVLAGLVFSAELALYAFIAVFIASKTIDIVQEGPMSAKTALIISRSTERISDRVFKEMERGVTALKATGMYTSTERDILMIIVSRHEIHQLRSIVHTEDPKAFMVISDTAQVLGEGFTPFVMKRS